MGRATILEEKRGGWVKVYVTEDRCIGCKRAFSRPFTLRRSRLDHEMFDDVTCPHCHTRNYARITRD